MPIIMHIMDMNMHIIVPSIIPIIVRIIMPIVAYYYAYHYAYYCAYHCDHIMPIPKIIIPFIVFILSL